VEAPPTAAIHLTIGRAALAVRSSQPSTAEEIALVGTLSSLPLPVAFSALRYN